MVSIIIPAYNVERYIHRAIESSLDQTCRDVEVVVVDDGSTDQTWDVIQQYAAEDCRLIAVANKNGGVSKARNEALRRARGEYVLFLDADDWLEKEAVETLLTLQQQHPRKLVSADCFMVDLTKEGGISQTQRIPKGEPVDISCEEALIALAEGRYGLSSACYKLFSLEKIKEKKLSFAEEIHNGEDGLFVFCYLHYTEGLFYCAAPLWDILNRPGSATRAGYKRFWLTAMDAVDQMLMQDNTKAVQKKLCGLFVHRTTMVLQAAMRSEEDVRKDIAYMRKRLKKMAGMYLFGRYTARGKIVYLAVLFVPVAVWKKYYASKNRHLDQGEG